MKRKTLSLLLRPLVIDRSRGSHPPDGSVRPERETGSAYVVTLLALIVLTIVGLSLALITQSEMQLGANERTVNRVFYSADSGIAATTSRALVSADYGAKTYTLDEPAVGLGPSFSLVEQIDVSPFFPILDAPCNLCEINNAGSYSERSYRKINHAVTARAIRRGGPSATPLAEKTLSAMVEVQPWRSSIAAYLPINDPAQLDKIKF